MLIFYQTIHTAHGMANMILTIAANNNTTTKQLKATTHFFDTLTEIWLIINYKV